MVRRTIVERLLIFEEFVSRSKNPKSLVISAQNFSNLSKRKDLTIGCQKCALIAQTNIQVMFVP